MLRGADGGRVNREVSEWGFVIGGLRGMAEVTASGRGEPPAHSPEFKISPPALSRPANPAIARPISRLGGLHSPLRSPLSVASLIADQGVLDGGQLGGDWVDDWSRLAPRMVGALELNSRPVSHGRLEGA